MPYKRTKLEAEQIVMGRADGVDAVVVNPTTPVGDGDHFPTPTGRCRGVANGKYRAYVDTGINVVDVRDVARGHILAWERGRRASATSWAVSTCPSPTCSPSSPSWGTSAAEAACSPRGRRWLLAAGLVNGDEVLLARLPMYFSWAKAEREFGYAPGPVWPALRRAVDDALRLRWPSQLKNWPIAITAMKMSPTTSIESTMCLPSSATSRRAGGELEHRVGL